MIVTVRDISIYCEAIVSDGGASINSGMLDINEAHALAQEFMDAAERLRPYDALTKGELESLRTQIDRALADIEEGAE